VHGTCLAPLRVRARPVSPRRPMYAEPAGSAGGRNLTALNGPAPAPAAATGRHLGTAGGDKALSLRNRVGSRERRGKRKGPATRTSLLWRGHGTSSASLSLASA
jgi:hypothetical protein